MLSWSNLSYSIRQDQATKSIIENVSGYAAPGEVLAIMGSSGAGKTSLLNALAGRISEGNISGRVFYNGSDRNPETWQNIMGYVQQEDLLYANLSVYETLRYTALLRLPSSMTYSEKMDRVNTVANALSLGKCLHTRIGQSGDRGISGGERKRVSIAIELLTMPRLLFLDEPTSGLDAYTASKIIECICSMAKKDGSTVILTIHQPREYILSMFTNIILLSQGKLIYFGSVPNAVKHFERCGYPCPVHTNPSDHFLDVITVDISSNEMQMKSLERVKAMEEQWSNETLPPVQYTSPAANPKQDCDKRWTNSFLYELRVLCERGIKEEIRDKATIGATFGQAIVNTLLLGFVFWRIPLDSKGAQNLIGVLFFICIQLTFGTVMPTITLFTQQREIIRRERASKTFRSSAVYLAKIISSLPLLLVSTAVFALPVYWMVGLYNGAAQYMTFLVALFVHVVTAAMIGIMISSGVPNVRVGQIIGPIIIVVFLIFGGQIVNVSSTPIVFRWIRWVSLVYLSYSALAQNEFELIRFDCGQSIACAPTGKAVLELFDLDDLWLWYCVLINASMAIAYAIAGYWLFDWRTRPVLRLQTNKR